MASELTNAVVLLLTVLYALLTDHSARIYLTGKSRFENYARPVLVGTVSLHLFALVLRGIETGTCPVLTRWEALSFIAFCVAAIYLVLELRRKIRVTAVFILGLAALLQFCSAVFVLSQEPVEGLGSPNLSESFHAFAAMLGISGVAVAGMYGFLYLRLDRTIRRGQYASNFFKRMPSLEDLGDLTGSAARLAFLSLSVTVGLGIWNWLARDPNEELIALPLLPIITTLALWALLGFCAIGHRLGKFGGVRLAWCTLCAFAAALGLLVSLGPQGVHG